MSDDDSHSYRDARLYRDSARVPLAVAIGRRARLEVHDVFMKVMSPSASTSVLDVGVSDDNANDSTNMLERLYPWPERLTCAGIQAGEGFRQAFPQHAYVRIKPGEPLPFAAKSFDVAYSNAVIEHVGSDQRQREFVAEMDRVAKRVFIVAPNRWFPVEHHTGLPFLHWIPLAAFRACLRQSRFVFWSKEENLNPITRRKLRRLFPTAARPALLYSGVGGACWKSNVIAYT